MDSGFDGFQLDLMFLPGFMILQVLSEPFMFPVQLFGDSFLLPAVLLQLFQRSEESCYFFFTEEMCCGDPLVLQIISFFLLFGNVIDFHSDTGIDIRPGEFLQDFRLICFTTLEETGKFSLCQ